MLMTSTTNAPWHNASFWNAQQSVVYDVMLLLLNGRNDSRVYRSLSNVAFGSNTSCSSRSWLRYASKQSVVARPIPLFTTLTTSKPPNYTTTKLAKLCPNLNINENLLTYYILRDPFLSIDGSI